LTDKKVYQQAIDTQDYCLLCGYGGELVMHHIRFGAGGRKTYVGNIARLCVRCHLMVHKNDKKYRPILIKKVDEIIGQKHCEDVSD
jgi:5-methylcytosine-specific restriction endonuclease McrA